MKTVCIFAIIFTAIVITSFSPDKEAQRISACMQQPGMEYTRSGGCIKNE